MTHIRRTYTVSGADLKRDYLVYRAIEALIDLVGKIAWFKRGYAEGFAAGQEAMRAECDHATLAHKSKIEGASLSDALPINPPCKPKEEK